MVAKIICNFFLANISAENIFSAEKIKMFFFFVFFLTEYVVIDEKKWYNKHHAVLVDNTNAIQKLFER